MRAEDVLPKALELPLDERTRLAALLMESIETAEEGDVENAWLDEITRRLDAHEKGDQPGIPARIVLTEARERLKRRG
jgi:putative addiction module component (TIGR02574 family)